MKAKDGLRNGLMVKFRAYLLIIIAGFPSGNRKFFPPAKIFHRRIVRRRS